MATAIVYYSKHHGNTKQLLHAIAAEDASVTLIDVTEQPDADLSPYDRIGLASGIYFSAFAKQIIAFAEAHLPESRDVFYIYTHGAPVGGFLKSVRAVAKKKNCREIGRYHCYGYDTFGPFGKIGGIAKGHPSEKDIAKAVAFFRSLQEQTPDRQRKIDSDGTGSEEGKEMAEKEKAGIGTARREDWKTEPMPEQHAVFELHRSFSDEEMEALRMGNVPQSMEDKWFWYMEGSTLWAHRSWSGFCIYRIDFKEDGHHVVTVNRDPEQYACTEIEEDVESLNGLLDWWIRAPYDHYGEWLSETHKALKKAKK